MVAPARPARFAKATLIWAAARKPHSVSLRFTARGLRRAFDEPQEKGTGFVWRAPGDRQGVSGASPLR
jgi:hypothetical protein